MLVVPTAAVPNQVLTVALGGQRCTLRIYQRRGYAQDRAASTLAAELSTEAGDVLQDEGGAALAAEAGA